MALRADELARRWRDGSTVEVLAEMMGLTLVIVANTLFGATVDGEVEEIGSALTAVFEMFGFALMPFSELFDRVPIPTTIRLRRARARLDATIYRIIAERRKSGRDHGDLLSNATARAGYRRRGRWRLDDRRAAARRGDDALRRRARDDLECAHVDLVRALPESGRRVADARGARRGARRSEAVRCRSPSPSVYARGIGRGDAALPAGMGHGAPRAHRAHPRGI